MTVTIHTSEPCPALINYLGDPYGAIIDMDYGVQERAALQMWQEQAPMLQQRYLQQRSSW